MNRPERSRGKIEPPSVSIVIFNIVVAFAAISGLASIRFGQGAFLLSGFLLLLQLALAVQSLDLRHRSLPWLLLLWLVSIWVAVLVGVENHRFNYAPYSAAKSGRPYEDVNAGTRAAAFMDAGRISFDKNTILDDAFSVGMSLFGSTYCAAPIMNKASVAAPTLANAGLGVPVVSTTPNAGTNGFTQFWAVGKDCCGSRGTFDCDSAGQPGVHSGIVLRDMMEQELESFAHFDAVHQSGFLAAIRAACALYEMEMPEVPVLMYWVSDPDRVLLGWFTRCLLVWILSSVAYGILAAFIWFLVDYHFDAGMRIGVEEWATGRPHHPQHELPVSYNPSVPSYGGAFRQGGGKAAVALDQTVKMPPAASGTPFQGLLPSRTPARRSARDLFPSLNRSPAGARSPSPTPGWRAPASVPPRGSRDASPSPAWGR